MSKTINTSLARIKRKKVRENGKLFFQPSASIDSNRRFREINSIRVDAVRYGNHRKFMARLKIKARRIARHHLKDELLNEINLSV